MALIADVFDVVLIDDNGDAIGTTTLQDANIEVNVQENDVRGGKNNQLLAILHSDRDITINLTEVEFRYDWLAKQLGQDIKTGAGVAYAMPKWYEVSTNSITLDHEPSDTDSVVVYDEDGEKLTPVTVTGSTVELPVGTSNVVEVRTYAYATAPETQIIEIDNSVFAKGVMAVLETIEIDNDENPTHTIQYQFTRALPSGNFTVSTASERNAATQDISLRVIKPKTSTKVGQVLRIPMGA